MKGIKHYWKIFRESAQDKREMNLNVLEARHPWVSVPGTDGQPTVQERDWRTTRTTWAATSP